MLKPLVGEAFSDGNLFMSETDGSSFPNGGLRITHAAAAFMSWDKTSPPYILGDTLFIPSAFATFNGEALDHKTPLLRSQEAINKEGLRLLKVAREHRPPLPRPRLVVVSSDQCSL